MSKKPIYITTTLPYVNNEPHVGFAMEIIRADALARYFKLLGHEVFFNTGTDEHGQKLFTAAQKEGKDVKDYVDFYAEKFRGLKNLLGITDDVHFIRTTDEHHIRAAQEIWRRVDGNGFIYKKSYKAKYCVGCELEKTDSELVDGRCPIHPDKDLELIDEENYFFAFSKLQDELKDLYKQNKDLVIPNFRFNEAKAFLDRGLQDFSISRLKEKMSWGVPVPNDEDHVMYVWFDALTNYISTLGWPEDESGDYKKFWEEGLKIQVCGKDNLRQQSMMWQAMLLAAKLPTTDRVLVNGFINSGGQKMSKSLGNVINPYDLVEEYEEVSGDLSSDVLRYYLLRHMNSFEDSDMTLESFKEAYNAHLANGLGNLVSRVMNMAVSYEVDLSDDEKSIIVWQSNDDLSDFDLAKKLNNLFIDIENLDKQITEKEPFKKIKINPEEAKKDLHLILKGLFSLVLALEPYMPKTSKTIIDLIKENKKPEKPLFLRKD